MSETHYPQLFCMTRYILCVNVSSLRALNDNVPSAPDMAGIDPERIKFSVGLFLGIFLV